MTIIKQCLLFIVLVLASSVSFASPIDTMQLQKLATSYLANHEKDEHISAISITLYAPHFPQPVTVYAGDMGFKDQQPINANSLFQIGSVAKSFVAALLLRLESNPANHFNIDDPIDKYFPEYKNWHNVTVRDLLNMTSGIPDYLEDPYILAEYTARPYQDYDLKPWINKMYQEPLLFTPGTKFNYSNTNYILLAMLIEKLTGHSLGQEIEANFIQPLQLKHTFYVNDQPSKSLQADLVHGYQFERGFARYLPLGTDVTHFSLSYMQAAGGVIANSRDMSKWLLALFTPGKVLTDAQLRELTTIYSSSGVPVPTLTPQNPNGYGLGISMQYSASLNTTIYIYQGMTFGYRAIYVYVPKDRVLISITVNSSFDGKDNHLLGLINQVGALVLPTKA